MNTKEFAVMMDDVVGKVFTQAYVGNDMHSLNCERIQRGFKYVIGNGYFKLGVECYGGQLGCWWTGALSLREHELVLGEMRDICYEKAFCCQVREFLWACVHKMNALADKRRCSGFVWPAIRPIEEYVEAGNTDAFVPDAETIADNYGTDEPIDEDYIEEDAADELTLEDEITAAMRTAAESDGETEQTMPKDEGLDGFISGGKKKKKKGFFGRRKADDEPDDIESMGDDHVHPELAGGYFNKHVEPMEEAETLDELGDI